MTRHLPDRKSYLLEEQKGTNHRSSKRALSLIKGAISRLIRTLQWREHGDQDRPRVLKDLLHHPLRYSVLLMEMSLHRKDVKKPLVPRMWWFPRTFARNASYAYSLLGFSTPAHRTRFYLAVADQDKT